MISAKIPINCDAKECILVCALNSMCNNVDKEINVNEHEYLVAQAGTMKSQYQNLSDKELGYVLEGKLREHLRAFYGCQHYVFDVDICVNGEHGGVDVSVYMDFL